MDAATIEEANKLRVKMGMKPLPVPGAAATAEPESDDDRSRHDDSDGEPASTIDTRQAAAYDNYRDAQKADAEKRTRAERAAALKMQIEKEQRLKKLEGKTLGDEKAADVDAKAWLVGQKKRQKKIDKARKLEQEQAEAEAQAAAALEYTSKDLAGLQVAHDVAEFEDGDDQILTLKDASIDQLEEDGDELENLDLRDAQKLKERLELKKGIRNYNPLDMDDFNLLSKYDEEIYGKKSERFTLDTNGAVAALENLLDNEAAKAKPKESTAFDIDMIDGTGQPSTDYLDISAIKVKKPKKSKKSQSTRKRNTDNDDLFPVATEEMEVDLAPSKKRKMTDTDLGDDDDLQAALAKQRRAVLKQRKMMKPEDIAKQLKEEAEEDASEEPAGLIIGEVSEFVSSIGVIQDEVKKPKKKSEHIPSNPPASATDADGDAEMGEAQPITYREYTTKEQESTGGGGDDDDDDDDEQQQDQEEDALLDEKTVDQGMGATLALMRERGILKETNSAEIHAKLRNQEEFKRRKRQIQDELEEQARTQREHDRNSGRLNRMSAREREEYARQQNAQRETLHQRRLNELFQEFYQPTFEIKYVDEDGRRLNTKEAFKQMSHAFHGKGSGKAKTELKMKKIEEEKRREAQSVLDASKNVGMSSVTAQQLKKRKEAGVRLA